MKLPGLIVPNALQSGRFLAFDVKEGASVSVGGSFIMPQNDTYIIYDSSTHFEVTNKNASLTFNGSSTLGAFVSSADTSYGRPDRNFACDMRHYFNMANGGTMTFNGTVSQTWCGGTFFNVNDGGTLEINGTATLGGTHATGMVTVAKGGLLKGTGNLVLGSKDSTYSSSTLLVDGGQVDIDALSLGHDVNDTGVSSIIFTNGANVLSTTFYLNHGTMDLTEGIAWTNRGYSRMGCNYTGRPTLNLHPGSLLYSSYFYMGDKYGESTLNMKGGTLVVSNQFVIGDLVTATGIVNMTSGVITCAKNKTSETRMNVGEDGCGWFYLEGGAITNQSLYVPYGGGKAGCLGEMVINGGDVYLTDSLGIGHGGEGTLTVNGGKISANYAFLGQSGDGGRKTWATFRQKGGLAVMRTGSADLGFKMPDANGRQARVILEGGETQVNRIYGHMSKAHGVAIGDSTYTGKAVLIGNGGTLKSYSGTTRLIYYMDEAKVGPKGLIIYAPKNCECTIEQDFTDMEEQDFVDLGIEGGRGAGQLILTGDAVKTLCATNSRCSYVVAAGGTTLFTPYLYDPAKGVQAVQDSSFIITNNATVSLEGDQTSLTIKDLTLGNAVSAGRLKLDATDVIHVKGTLTVNKGIIEITSALNAGETLDVLDVAGDQSVALRDAWAKITVVSSADATARHATTITYDSATGKTKLSVEKVDASATITDATWAGANGAWETAANWADNVMPGLYKRAVFTSETAANEVALTQAERVAALSLGAAQGYAISGGTLAFTPVEARAVEVTKGAHTISSPIVAEGVLPVNVAEGTSLTLGGALQVDALVKNESGELNLSGVGSAVGAVALSNGVLAVSSPAAVPGAAITQAAGTLKLAGGADDIEATYDIALNLQNPAATTNILAIKVDDGKARMPTPTTNWRGGLFVKRGAGTLTWVSSAAATMLSYSDGAIVSDWYPSLTPIELDAYDQILPEYHTNLAGFNVLEGEMVLTKDTQEASFKSDSSYLTVGIPQLNTVSPATLTLDGVYLSHDGSGHHLLLGARVSQTNTSWEDAYFNMRNGAKLLVNTYYVAREAEHPTYRWHTHIDNSTLECSYGLQANASTIKGTGSISYFTFTNGAACYTPWVNVPGRAAFEFDSSCLAGRNGAACQIFRTKNVTGDARSGVDLTFRNGSKFTCRDIEVYGYATAPTTLHFDNSEWDVATDDFMLVRDYPAKFEVSVSGAGLIMAPAAGSTWKIAHQITGAGGFVKRGAGTVVFSKHKRVDPADGATNDYADVTTTLNFTGLAKVEAGMLQVEPGAALAGAAFEVATAATLDFAGGNAAAFSVRGAGTVKNAVLSATTLPLDVTAEGEVSNDLPSFETASITFGRMLVDFGCTAENPIAWPFAPVVVGHYVGNAPASFAGWRVVNTGLEGVYGTFTAADGNITVTLKRTGTILYIR